MDNHSRQQVSDWVHEAAAELGLVGGLDGWVEERLREGNTVEEIRYFLNNHWDRIQRTERRWYRTYEVTEEDILDEY